METFKKYFLRNFVLVSLIFSFQICFFTSRAQSINFYLTSDSVIYGGTEYYTFWASAIIENNSLNPVTIKAIRLINDMPNFPNWQSAMCADLCYPVSVDSIQFTIQPDTSQLFKMMFRYWVHNADTAHTFIHFQSVSPGIIFEKFQNFYAMDSIVLTTSITENFNYNSNSLSIYPNPFIDKLNIQYSEFRMGDEIKFYDIYGKEVFSQPLTTVSAEIQTSNWNSGIYFVKAGRIFKKILKLN